MSTAAASILFLCLIMVSLAHFVWAFGGTWPIRNRELLAATVIGREGVDRVPRLAALLVAILVLVAAALGVSLGERESGGLPLTLVGLALGLVFAVRGIFGYTAAWRRHFPREPFASLDRKFYSPLCVVVAVCFLVLVAMRLT